MVCNIYYICGVIKVALMIETLIIQRILKVVHDLKKYST